MSWSHPSFVDQQGTSGELFTPPWARDPLHCDSDDASLTFPPALDGADYHDFNANEAWPQWAGPAEGSSLDLQDWVDPDEGVSPGAISPPTSLANTESFLPSKTPCKTHEQSSHTEPPQIVPRYGETSHRVDVVSEVIYDRTPPEEDLAQRLEIPTIIQPSTLTNVTLRSATSWTKTVRRSPQKSKRRISPATACDVERSKKTKRKHEEVEKKDEAKDKTSNVLAKRVAHDLRQLVPKSVCIPIKTISSTPYHEYHEHYGTKENINSRPLDLHIETKKLSDRQSRNRKAAERSRAKSNASVQQLKDDEYQVSTLNQELNEERDQLRSEVLHLREAILAHMNCDCVLIQKYVSVTMR